jgi:prevent-host-death family protein
MKTVGMRELKNRLSEYIRHVRAGEGVLVTDRGQVVAELTPPGQGATDPSVPSGLLALSRRNLVVIGAPRTGDLYPALPRARRRTRTARQLLHEERGDR